MEAGSGSWGIVSPLAPSPWPSAPWEGTEGIPKVQTGSWRVSVWLLKIGTVGVCVHVWDVGSSQGLSESQ